MKKEEFRRALKPIADGLFGKQGAVRYERPHFAVRPLERMLRDLTAIPLEDQYAYAFSREPLNGKFNDEQRKKWTAQAIGCGREYAKKICSSYGVTAPEALAQAMGLEVLYPSFPENADRVLFAEFREPGNINIYMDAVKKAEKFLKRPEIKAVLTDRLDVAGLLLAHELFHFVEEKYKKEIFTKKEKLRLWSLGPLHNDSSIIALSEIAAMAFAQTVTGISWSPYVMDVFLVYGYSPEEASGLYEEMMMYAGREPCAPEQETL